MTPPHPVRRPNWRNFAYEDREDRIRFWQRRCDHPDGRRDIWYVTPRPDYPTNVREGVCRKPPDSVTDKCIYVADAEVWEAIAGGGGSCPDVVWCEGESDADAVDKAGFLAFTHHGGAGALAKPGQARLLRRFRGTVYVAVDLDGPGALDAMTRVRLLGELGLGSRRVELIAAAGYGWRETGGADLRDHLSRARLDDVAVLSPADLYTRAEDERERRRKATAGPGEGLYWGEPLPPLRVVGSDGKQKRRR